MTACWDVINTEWDPDQETVNFGTRQCVVVDSALFDVVTLATVECSVPVIRVILELNEKFKSNFAFYRERNQNQKCVETCGSHTQCWRLITFATFLQTAARLF